MRKKRGQLLRRDEDEKKGVIYTGRETLTNCTPVIFYLHRFIEKSWNKIGRISPMLTKRLILYPSSS